MNVENIKRVRDQIAAVEARRFNMSLWAERLEDEEGPAVGPADLIHDCNTCGCIGGWTDALFGAGKRQEDAEFAAEVLGLDDADAQSLFFPWGHSDASLWGRITQAEAVRVLDHLIETGEVDWTVARESA